MTLDDGQPRRFSLVTGESRSFEADARIVLALDEGSSARIVVNGIQRVRPGDAVAPNAVTMDSLVTKRVVLPGAQPEAPAGSAQPAAEAKADTTTAPAAKAETKPANAKTAANAQRLPADRA